MLRLSIPLSLALVLLAACGGSSEEVRTSAGLPASSANADARTPEDVALAFFETARSGDDEALARLFTEKARAGVASGEGIQIDAERLGEFEIGTAIVEGDQAKVPTYAVLDGEGQDMRLLMRREAGAWRLFGFDVSIGGEGWMTFNLESIEELLAGFAEGMATQMAGAMEEAFSDWSQGGSEEEIAAERARFESLQPLTEDEHASAWQVDLDARDEPADGVLAGLVEGSGLVLEGTPEGSITLRLSGVSRAEAIERVCAELDVHPVWPEPNHGWDDSDANTLGFEPGPRAWPVTFAGPFLIEITELAEKAPTTTGSLALAVRAVGLAPECLAYQTEMVELCSVETIEGPAGENLNGDDGVTFLGTPDIVGGYLTDTTNFDLKGLMRDVERVRSVRGSVSIAIPTAIAEARCSSTQEPVRSGPFEVRPKEWGTYTTFEVLAASGEELDANSIEVRLSPTSQGAPLGMLTSDSMGWGDVVQASLQTPEAPEHVDLKICTTRTLRYEFELNDVPLAHFAEMPAELAELEFVGPAPFEVEFVRFTSRDADFPEVELTVRNLCNKDANSVVAMFRYLDDSGQPIDDGFQHTLTGTFGVDGPEPFAAGTNQTHRTTAFFMPEETERLRVSVTQVEFFDASTWSAPE